MRTPPLAMINIVVVSCDIRRFLSTLLVTSAWSDAGWGACSITASTCSTTVVATDGNFSTDNSWNTNRLANRYAARDALRFRHHSRLTHLAAGCVWNAFGARLLNHAARCVRNPLRDTLSHHAASRIRYSFCHTLIGPRAGCVRNFLCARVLSHVARRIRYATMACLIDVRARCVRHFFRAGHRNLTAGCVRHFRVTDLRDHSCAADLFFHRTRHPTLTANLLRWSRATDFLCATRIAGILDTLFDHRSRDTLCVGFPSAAANVNCLGFSDRFHHRVAAISITGLRLSAVGGVAAIPITCFVHGLAYVVADIPIASFVDRLTNVVADISIACLVAWLANIACDSSVTRFNDWLTDLSLNTAVVCFIDRFANCIALVSIARLIDVSHAADGYCFRTAVHHDFHRLTLLLLPHNFSNCFVCDTTAAFCICEVATRIAIVCGDAAVSSQAQQSRIRHTATHQHDD